MVIGIDASRANVRERTGTEWYSYHLIRALTALDRHHRYVLYFDQTPIDEFRHLGPHVEYRVLRWPWRFLWNQLRLSLEMLWRPPDVLFVPAHTIPLIHPRRTVTTLHDVGFERFPELYGREPIGGRGLVGQLLNTMARLVTRGRYGNNELDYHRWSARFAVAHAARLITVSEFTKSEIVDCYGADPERIAVIHHGFDPEVFRRPDQTAIAAVRKRFALTSPYVLFVGRLEQKKNLNTLIDVFNRARIKLPSLKLVLVGTPGRGWGVAAERINTYGLDQAVFRLGWQPRNVYVPLLAGAAALIFLSRYEGFGLPVLESFAVGTPVVVAAGSSLPEVAGRAALIVHPDDIDGAARTVVKLVNNRTLRQALVTSGRHRLQAFSWKQTAQATLDVLVKPFQFHDQPA
ncbi:MAG: glycosyltransferase family 4 protein [Candidatus Kerfeldbacteria bacterium]|nr:glycosyltransferase family 4 protein [Candidatus Kerfeldbacteria bacterium]